jgi:hypothetical protein
MLGNDMAIQAYRDGKYSQEAADGIPPRASKIFLISFSSFFLFVVLSSLYPDFAPLFFLSENTCQMRVKGMSKPITRLVLALSSSLVLPPVQL